jgi:hypothetical protein
LWQICLLIALNYIALVFAADFIEEPLKRGGIAHYPLSYLPFALMLVGGICLRVAAFAHRKLRNRGPKQRVVGVQPNWKIFADGPAKPRCRLLSWFATGGRAYSPSSRGIGADPGHHERPGQG